DGAHVARHRLVTRKIRGHEHCLRAQPFRAQRRHGRTDAEAPRLVARRADHRARPAPGHHHRAATQARVVALLHGRVERVHVDVDDLAHRSIVRPGAAARGLVRRGTPWLPILPHGPNIPPMKPVKTIAAVGVAPELLEELKQAIAETAPRLDSDWRWGSEQNPDLLVIDPGDFAARMARTRAQVTGVRYVVVGDAAKHATDRFVLLRPYRKDA